MSNYVKVTDFAVKDPLPTGDPNKRVRGTELDAEFEAIETAVATKADLSSPGLTGVPTGPTATAGNNTTQLATTAHVKLAIANALGGMIVIWSGSVASIPTGWVLCDGTNGTPDLRDKFVLGAGGSAAVASSGGAVSKTTTSSGGHSHGGATASHTLTSAQIPAHSHQVPQLGVGSTWGADSRWPFQGSAPGYGRNVYSDQPYSTFTDGGSGGGHSHGISAEAAHTHDISDVRPPFYALAFIMKTV
jgi:hypothetical protein